MGVAHTKTVITALIWKFLYAEPQVIRETHKGLNQPLAVSMAVSTFGICQFPTLEYSEPIQTLKTVSFLE